MSISDNTSESQQGLTKEEEECLLRDIEENHFGLPNLGVGEYPSLKKILDADSFYPAHGQHGNHRRRVYIQRVTRLKARIKRNHAGYLMLLHECGITPHSVHSSVCLKKATTTMPSTRSAKSTKDTSKHTDDSSDEEDSRMPPVPDFVCKSPSKCKPKGKASKSKSSSPLPPLKRTPKKGISTLDPGTGYHTIDVCANSDYPERNIPLRIESFSYAPCMDPNTNEKFAVAGFDIYVDNVDERWVTVDAYKAVIVSEAKEDAQMVEILLPAHPYDEIYRRKQVVAIEGVMNLHDARIEEEKTIARNELMKDKSRERLLVHVHFEHLDIVLDNKIFFSPENPRTIKLHLIPVPHISPDPYKDDKGNAVPTVINHIRWRVAVYEEEKRIIDSATTKSDKEGETSVNQARAAIKGMVFK